MPGSADPRQMGLGPSFGMEDLTRTETSIEGVVESIIFRNEANGYSVVALSGSDDVVAVGILPYLSEGESVRLHGSWSEHPDYGRQFQVGHYEAMVPSSRESILSYLGSGIIKGVGEKTARKLVREFGEATLDVLREQPERVARIKGIGAAKAQLISEQLLEKREYQEIGRAHV